jgi:hypothetical protein
MVDLLIVTLAVVAMVAVGAVLTIRVPANKVGWLLLVAGLALGLEFLGIAYANASDAFAGGSWPGTVVAVWLYSNLLVLPVLIMAIGIPLIYPDGRLLSPRWRWLVALVVWSGVVEFLKGGFRPGLIPDTNVENPFGIPGIEPFLSVFDLHLPAEFGAVFFLAALASVVIRYRRGGLVQRQQLKWLIAVTAVEAIAWLIVGISQATGAAVLMPIGWYGALLGMAGLPAAIGIAVLRYRLYEIDRIISRTIAWAVVTAVLVAVFAGGVVGLQTALTGITQGDTLAVAASTLVAFALFQPLRRRVQRVVDRRFDRAMYDAQRTAEAFSDRLREEVDLDAVVGDLEATVASAVKPTSFGLWLRPGHSRADGRS